VAKAMRLAQERNEPRSGNFSPLLKKREIPKNTKKVKREKKNLEKHARTHARTHAIDTQTYK